jgi:hypothetical protein
MGTNAIRNKTYGPFQLISETTDDGNVFLSLPYAEVQGSQVLVAVADNYGVFPSQFAPNHLFPGVEITIWGAVMGFETCLRRQFVRQQTGPLALLFEWARGWDNILFRGRNMNGGSVVNLGGIPPFPTQANHFSLTSTVYIFPRGGFASPDEQASAPSSTSNMGCKAG